ncbi:MAG: valine--tRNA ligase [Acidobacteriota bacterium]
MDKRFDPKSYEGHWQQRWAEMGIFVCEAPSSRPSFCIMIPPPNVTGKLHMGHALQSTLQDLLVRWKRMQGYNALWLPGTDHAGIATQLMVERQLVREGTSRAALGREAFLERTWAWKKQYHGNIRRQLDLMGASCDWTRERFTLDEGLSMAVREAFVRLHAEGLITRGEYIVNWSPALGTAVSDLEVEMKPVRGKLYHIAYDVDGSGERIVVATTRPETMLGDTAVAFHPDDERYRHLIGKFAILPLVGRRLPFVADAKVEKDFGTGLVKVTPAHDAFDFELGRRHGLPILGVIGRDGKMTVAAGAQFAGLDREAARALVVETLRAEGRLVKVEEHEHNVGHSQRSGEPIEPLISTQWFCDVSGMAARALEAEKDGTLRLIPESWGKTWEHWLANIKPWCISRQLWWGHQIPAWFRRDGTFVVARSREEAVELAGTDELEQDPDVLDTWFSSALWPFSTLGWPEQTADLATFYPTNVLVTGFDILFFWVARMVMTGLHFTDRVPFSTVHLTGLVRDADGQKMSKTKGNVVDPESLIEEHGADALRFTLALLDAPGRDIPLDPERMAGYRAFGNKIWNAARFVLEPTAEAPAKVGNARVQSTLDVATLGLPERWILSRLSRTAAEVEQKFTDFRFDEACNQLYHFFWGELCDWYIEFCKPVFAGTVAEAERPRVGEVLLTVLDRALRLLHPVMPFLTEEIWQRLPGHEAIHPETICLAPFPTPVAEWESDEHEARMASVMELVTRVRALRTERKISAKTKTRLYLAGAGPLLETLRAQAPLVKALCRLEAIELGSPPAGAVLDSLAGVEFALVPEAGAKEAPAPVVAVLDGQLVQLRDEIARAEARLADESFVSKAPARVVEGNRARLAELRERYSRLAAGAGE